MEHSVFETEGPVDTSKLDGGREEFKCVGFNGELIRADEKPILRDYVLRLSTATG